MKKPRKNVGAARKTPPPTTALQLDLREQLVNEGLTGPIQNVALPEAMITSLRGILLDLDPSLFRDELLAGKCGNDVDVFYTDLVRPMLQRHPVLSKAEVRASGRGLHGILRFDHPVQIRAEAERLRWGRAVRVVQRTLPSDPDCPGLTALTRPVGSFNGKSKTSVCLLEPGTPLTAGEVLGLVHQVSAKPFRTVASILLGPDHLSPCPVCRHDGSRLDVLDTVGHCYGSCGKITLAHLFDLFLQPRG